MINLIIMTIMFLFIGNILGQVILIQTTPKFKLVKKHPLTVIALYYGFFIYLFSDKEKNLKFKIRYIFIYNKFLIFTYCFCHCLEQYIATHPQKELFLKKNIKYMSTRSMRTNVYRNTKRSLMYA